MRYDHIPPQRWWQRAKWRVSRKAVVSGITIPTGFVTDGASIPWLLRLLVSPTGKAMEAATLHDFLLFQLSPTDSRENADWYFLKAMRQCGVKEWRAQLMYAAVHSYGEIKVFVRRLIKKVRKG